MVHINNPNVSNWKVGLLINDQKVMFKMDMGAQCNVMSQQMYAQVCDKPLQSSCTKLVSFGGQCLQACGKATVLCQHKRKCYSVDFEVIDEIVPNILGLHTCTETN